MTKRGAVHRGSSVVGVRQPYACSFSCIGEGDRLADAARRSGNQNDVVVQSEVHIFPTGVRERFAVCLVQLLYATRIYSSSTSGLD